MNKWIIGGGSAAFSYNKDVIFENINISQDLNFKKKCVREICKALHVSSKNLLENPDITLAVKNIIVEYKPDVIISYEPDSLFYLHLANEDKIPVIQMVHSCIEVTTAKLTKRYLEDANKVDYYQVLLPSFVEKAKKYIKSNIICIPNCAPLVDKGRLFTRKDYEQKKIVYISRMEETVKRPHILLKSFANIVCDFPDWQLEFYGGFSDCAYEEKLQKYIYNNKLGRKVFIKGITNDSLTAFAGGSIFAFPTKYEGFPLTVLEAMSLGIPCVAFADAIAVQDIVKDGYNGLLACNQKDFENKLRLLMSDVELRSSLGKNAIKTAEQFNAKNIWDAWEKLIVELVYKRDE